MFIYLSREQILKLEKNSQASFISLWDTLDNAELFYNAYPDIYTGYIENQENIKFALSTPVKIYKLYCNTFDIL